MQLTIPQLITLAQQTLDQTLVDATFQLHLTRFGFTAHRLQEGTTLYQELVEISQSLKTAYQSQLAATELFYRAWRKAKEQTQDHLTAARQALADEPAIHAIFAIHQRDFRQWAVQVQHFYERLLENPHYQAKLAAYGVDVVELQTGWELLATAETMKNRQIRRQVETERIFALRNEKALALAKWVNELRRAWHRAFVKTPDRTNSSDETPYQRIQVKIKTTAPLLPALAGV